MKLGFQGLGSFFDRWRSAEGCRRERAQERWRHARPPQMATLERAISDALNELLMLDKMAEAEEVNNETLSESM